MIEQIYYYGRNKLNEEENNKFMDWVDKDIDFMEEEELNKLVDKFVSSELSSNKN